MNTRYKTPILLIEDNPEDKKTAEKFLSEAGIKYDLYYADTLYEGTSFLEKTPVELVLLELNLRDSAGFKTLATYLERAPKTPVIVMTSLNNEIIGNQAIKAGAQDFLVKGQFDAKLFGRSVRYSLQRSKVQLELQKTTRELEINRKRFLEAQRMAHFGTWEMDLVSNAMTWSEEVFRIFSFTPHSLNPTLSEYLNYVPLDERPQVENFFEDAAKDGKLHEIEHRILVEGTNFRYVALQAKIQMEETAGKIILVGSIQDITERKISERLLIERNISSQTVKIQEEVLADLSFQIRTPLSSIVNLLFLLENTHTSSQQTAYVKDLKTSVNDLSISVNNLLNFSLMVSDNVKIEDEEVNIREFLAGTRNVVKIKADAGSVALDFDIDESLPEKIVLDPKKVMQILYNLLEHAIRNNKKFGHVVVSVKGHKFQASKGNLLLNIKNSGKDLSKAEIQELLQAEKLLQQSGLEEKDSVAQKWQLGIAIASKLINNMGGTLHIQSKAGEGTDFVVSLPVKIARLTKATIGSSPDAPLKILLVEDHFLNQIATKKVLTSWSDFVTVDIAENGLIAVEKHQEFGYDLILMDIQMPVMNGLDAARRLRQFSNVPIIALTANSTKQEQDKCFEIGMNDYLAKPFKPQELYARIMNALSLVLN
jgi:DNA-binding response OmpR family regulator/signal transduction histidine kinase